MLTLIGPDRPLRFAAHRQPLCWNFMYHSRIVLSVGGSVRYMVRNLRCIVTIDSVLANSKTQNAFLFTVHAIFRHDYPLAVEPASTPGPLVQNKTLRDSVPIDMLLSALSFLVVAQSSSEFPEGLMNNPVFITNLLHKVFIVINVIKLLQLFYNTQFYVLHTSPRLFHITIKSVAHTQKSYEKLLMNGIWLIFEQFFFLHVSTYIFCYAIFLFQFPA